jgi:hypothetical protein
MSAAFYWLNICSQRAADATPLPAADPWSRRLLSEVAGPNHVVTEMDQYRPAPLGKDGWIWRFSDGSALLANTETVIVR